MPKQDKHIGTSRRTFLKTGVAATIAGLAPRAARAAKKTQPNFVILFADQLGFDAIAAHGCPDVHTPNMDRLIQRGVTFTEAHSTDPVCSPARSSVFTGRMPVETGVVVNDRPILDTIPNMGQWLSQADYETVYTGKWHLPFGYQNHIDGFTVLPAGGGQGDLVDAVVSRSSEAYLMDRSKQTPFLLVTSLLQPHDICYWAIKGDAIVPKELPFPQLAGQLPELPPNHRVRPVAPADLDQRFYKGFTDDQWRYYLYTYYRQVEMLDADIGRVLDALDASGQAENTIIILTADHGDGRGRHMHVQKWYPYDEAVKVPLVISCPGRVAEGLRNSTHLVSGVDIMSTVCDFAGVYPPPDALGRSLRALIEERNTEWREYVVSEVQVIGRTLRTDRYKYVRYDGDPVEQLFDMEADPWETRNLYDDAKYADVIKDHRRLLDEWNRRMKPAPRTG